MKKYPIGALIIILFIIFFAAMSNSKNKEVNVGGEQLPHIIAHRGHWDTEGSAQNSRKALELAIAHGFYGCEFDVHLTKDNRVVVFHDHDIQGINIQTTDYADLKDLKLPNGETLPTLDEYLEIASKQKGTKLILEIKGHQGAERNREAAREVHKLVKQYGVEGITEYISFSMDVCKELIAMDDKHKVFFLHWDKDAPSPKELKAAGFYGLDYAWGAMKERPEWITEAREVGLKVNIWTVNDEADMRHFVEAGADFITTDAPELLKKVIDEKKKK
ncbi:glycerophosphodiester phosphodiesterase family protein [Dysgonomonas sp. 25]|uniref:glycerophosphodiester phosphodiesterase n=1 Tax=Dysgonomonas sp. 25 TaxID=2302933 RepID=UPI0013D8714B|nr:glycerophosphodiester phosphodiesterase family protein [Dysgonomonas sp. 25]NDV69200.1 glycerophosphodiester phosphodiesterase [Dysgonomonas sp. 25]